MPQRASAGGPTVCAGVESGVGEEQRVMVMAVMMLMAGAAAYSLKVTSSYVLTLTTIIYPVGFLMRLFYR